MTADTRPVGPGISGGQALQRLLDGNKRYAGAQVTHPNQVAARRTAVAHEQHPFACILGCSDSRVPLEIIFDQGLGDLFVVRVAGNIAGDDTVLGSIEFAVAELGVPLILVLGHQRCGAVQAALRSRDGGAPPGHIGRLVAAIQPAVGRVDQHLGDPLDNAVRANVELGVAQLRAAAPILAPAVQAGQVQIVGARYSLDSGLVDVII